MSKRQSVSAPVVVDDVSGSDSDKDNADELRVSMEGLTPQCRKRSSISCVLIHPVLCSVRQAHR